jgi:peptidoglycan hydrolase-like protein with peptidoglycan-binding domain
VEDPPANAYCELMLNADPDTQVAKSGAGSPGSETTYFGSATKKAIQKFQVKYGITFPGKSDYGVFGPKTKAKLNEIGRLKGVIK